MSRPRYIIKKLHISTYGAWRWVVVDCDKDNQDAGRFGLIDYAFETPEDAMIFCNYLNTKEGVVI